MASRALTTWRMERREHLDDLLQAREGVGGPTRGRRRTSARPTCRLSWALASSNERPERRDKRLEAEFRIRSCL